MDIGAQGGWLSEMAEACDVARSTMDEWAANHPEFSEALTRAKQKAQVWFEIKGREGLTADKFNAPLWQKQMSARHRDEYTEKVQTELSGKIQTEEVGLGVSKLAAFMDTLAERAE